MTTIKELEELESKLSHTGFKDIMRDRINTLKDVLKEIDEVLLHRRKMINEGISDERLLAHLHTFVNHFETEIQARITG